MADVKIPGLGNVPKGWVYGVGLGSAGLIAVLYYQHKKNAAAAAAASTAPSSTTTTGTSGIDPNTGIPYADEMGAGYGDGIDPTTGIPYADEYGNTGIGAGSVYPSYGGYYDPNTGQIVYPSTGTTVPPATTNGAWAQQAESYYSSSVGGDPAAFSAALGKYLTGQSLTSDQVSLVDQAIAFMGYPPQSGPNGYPPALNQSSGGGGGGQGNVSVPNVVGMQIDQAGPTIQAAGLVYSGPKPIPGLVVHIVSQSPSAGTSVASGSTVVCTGDNGGTGGGGGQVTVPNVVGLPIDQAGPRIQAAGLKYSGPAPVKGKVIHVTSETPAAGTRVAKGTTVRVLGK